MKISDFLIASGIVLFIIGVFLLLNLVATPFLIGPDCNPCQTLYGSWELALIVDDPGLVPSVIFIVIGVILFIVGRRSLDTRDETEEKKLHNTR